MNDSAIEQIIFDFHLDSWERDEDKPLHFLFNEQPELENDLFWKMIDDLENNSLIKCESYHEMYKITDDGILYAEDKKLFPSSKITLHKSLRFKILQLFNQIYEEKGRNGEFCFNGSYKKLEIPEHFFRVNLNVLLHLGYIESSGAMYFRITSLGVSYFKELQQKQFFQDEFERISKLTPKPRGIALQKLLAVVIEFADCPTEEGIRRSHEEMDIIAKFENSFYLIECKWQATKTGASVVRELYGKLENRSEIKGIIASMSGFSDNDKGAVSQVFEYANKKLILLFGKEDILQIINQPESFKSLVDEKYKALIIKKAVVWN